jgi:outer membrane protein assembly factor BamB
MFPSVDGVPIGFLAGVAPAAREWDLSVPLMVARDAATGSFRVDVVFEDGSARGTGREMYGSYVVPGNVGVAGCEGYGCDYDSRKQTLTVPAGAAPAHFSVLIATDERHDEGNETFTARLENVVVLSGAVAVDIANSSNSGGGAGLVNTTTVTIIDVTRGPHPAGAPWPLSRHDGTRRGSIVAPGTSTHRAPWTFSTPGASNLRSPVLGADGTLYAGSLDGSMYALWDDGTVRWTFATGLQIRSTPAISADGTVYFGSRDNNFYAVHGANGTLRWMYDTGFDMNSDPVIGDDGLVYVGRAESPRLLAFDAATGALVIDEAVPAEPTVTIAADGRLYYASTLGVGAHALGTGAPIWALAMTSILPSSSPVLRADGERLAFLTTGAFVSVATGDGTLLPPLELPVPAGTTIMGDIAVGPGDGSAYYMAQDLVRQHCVPYARRGRL